MRVTSICRLITCLTIFCTIAGFAQTDAEVSGTPQKSSPKNILQQPILPTVNYQGYLTDSGGNPVTGTLSAKIGIWDQETGGIQLWSEEQTIAVHLGYFQVELGSVSPFQSTIFDGSNRWVQVSIEDVALVPRKKLSSVPYSVQATNAAALGGYSRDQFYLKNQANDHNQNDIDASSLGGTAAGEFLNVTQLESAYVKRGVSNTVTSEMILDGTIKEKDLGFSLGIGDITGVTAENGLEGGGTTGDLRIGLTSVYRSGEAYNDRFVNHGEANSVTGAMIVDDQITSSDIKNGSIQQSDLAFPVSAISQISPGTGLTGGGNYGNVYLALNTEYQTGKAYDGRFVKREESNTITSSMISDGTVTSNDIMDGTIKQQDLAFSAGGISAVYVSNGIIGGGTDGAVTVQLEPAFHSGEAYDARFVNQNQPSSVTSLMIVNGTIKAEDLAFSLGDITGVQAYGGVGGGGVSGEVSVYLESSYATGDAYSGKFVDENQPNAITSAMIFDRTIKGADIAQFTVDGTNLANPLLIDRNQLEGAVLSVNNRSYSETSYGIEGRGYWGIKGFGTYVGVYGEGAQFGVYAKASNPQNYSLYVEGKAYCSTGGWGDLAEYVYSNEELLPGDVVVFDKDEKNMVKKCDIDRDFRVAGVISSDPTIVVGNKPNGDNNFPLVLAGIVPCKVVASEPIFPGDLLTTSSTPGYARKVTNPQVGTVLGKALEPLQGGTGIINVLVTMK
ncbi:hypothetical protein JW935_13550 [candidate division KSB1 bacterium]|nr:hypothetical protein [candidate division KSB1 bacterium]